VARDLDRSFGKARARKDLIHTAGCPETRHIILSADDARQTDAALPTIAHMSSPQTLETGATLQSAESASRAFSSGHSTATKSIDTDTGDLSRGVTPPYVALHHGKSPWPVAATGGPLEHVNILVGTYNPHYQGGLLSNGPSAAPLRGRCFFVHYAHFFTTVKQ